MGPMSPPQAVQHKFSQLFSNRPAINVEKARAFPVMVLSEIFPDIKIEWTEGSGRGDRQFKVEAEVQGRRFFGEVSVAGCFHFCVVFLFYFFYSYEDASRHRKVFIGIIGFLLTKMSNISSSKKYV